MLKKPLIDRLNRGKKTEIFHSSAYGRAQNGGSLGTASTESFAQRMQMEQSRKTIQRYDASEVAARRFNPEAKGANRVEPSSVTGVGKTGAQAGTNGARAGAKPQPVAPMRQVPKISWRPPRGF